MPRQDWENVGEYANWHSASAISRRLTNEDVPHRVVSSGLPDRDSRRWIEVPPEWADRAKGILAQPAVPEEELTEEALSFPRVDDADVVNSSKPSFDALLPSSVGRRPLSIVVTLWILLLVFGVLMLQIRGPLKAPPFEQLTQFVCDPLPVPPILGNRLQRYRLRLTCRDGGQVVYQRQTVSDGSNPNGQVACKKEGGRTTIWRMAPPDPYGGIVFHATCGEYIVVHYKTRASNYELTQILVTAIGSALVLSSAVALAKRWLAGAGRNGVA
jgi:hypothetical protein